MWADLVLRWLWTPHLHKKMESAERMKKSTEKNAGEEKTAGLGEKSRGISVVIQLSSLFNKLWGKEEGRVSRALQELGKFLFSYRQEQWQKYNLQEWSNKHFRIYTFAESWYRTFSHPTKIHSPCFIHPFSSPCPTGFQVPGDLLQQKYLTVYFSLPVSLLIPYNQHFSVKILMGGYKTLRHVSRATGN